MVPNCVLCSVSEILRVHTGKCLCIAQTMFFNPWSFVLSSGHLIHEGTMTDETIFHHFCDLAENNVQLSAKCPSVSKLVFQLSARWTKCIVWCNHQSSHFKENGVRKHQLSTVPHTVFGRELEQVWMERAPWRSMPACVWHCIIACRIVHSLCWFWKLPRKASKMSESKHGRAFCLVLHNSSCRIKDHCHLVAAQRAIESRHKKALILCTFCQPSTAAPKGLAFVINSARCSTHQGQNGQQMLHLWQWWTPPLAMWRHHSRPCGMKGTMLKRRVLSLVMKTHIIILRSVFRGFLVKSWAIHRH